MVGPDVNNLSSIHLTFLLIALASSGAQADTGFDPASDSGTLPTPIMPLEEVRPGMRVVAYTVFQGSEIEPFTGTVQGVVRNYLGPERHIIMVMFEGERLRHNGIVHGMSGSPVYADGRLIGALALALGPFQKDPLAGVTPIEYMLEDVEATEPFAPARGQVRLFSCKTRKDWPQQDIHGPSHPARVTSSTLEPEGGAVALRPLRSPLTIAGIDPVVFSGFASHFPWIGPVGVLAGGGRSPEPGTAVPTVSRAAAGLRPGSPVCAVLIDGDATLAATGTVTYRNGDEILAFGHPLMQQGPVAIPMATAEIVATVADQTYPYKLANPGIMVGQITRDQVTAIAGRIGPVPEMIPVQIDIRRTSGSSSNFSYRVVDVPGLTPALFQLLLANSLKKQWRYASEGVYLVDASLHLKGGLSVPVRQSYVVTPRVPGSGSFFDLVRDVAEPFSLLYNNRFQEVRFDSVDVRIETGDQVRLYRIDALHTDRVEVRPGDRLEVHVGLVRYRGERLVRTVMVPIPQGLEPGTLRLQVVDARSAERPGAPGGRLSVDGARSLEQLVDILTRTRRGDRCYLQLVARRPGLEIQNRQLTSLPGSARSVLAASVSGAEVRTLDEAVVWEEEMVLDGVVTGHRDRDIVVLPAL